MIICFRQTSDYICPSRFWVETEEEKGRLLGDYRRNLGQKECKYFNKVGYWHYIDARSVSKNTITNTHLHFREPENVLLATNVSTSTQTRTEGRDSLMFV